MYMSSQSETLLSPSDVIHPSRTVCLTQPEPAAILIDDSDSEDSIDEPEPERTQISTRGRKRQRENEPQTRRKRLRTSMASEASNNSEEEVIDLTSDRDVIDVETAPSASRIPVTPMTTRNASYPPATPMNSLMRSFGVGQYPQMPRFMMHPYQPRPYPAAALDFFFSALPSSASLRSFHNDYDYVPQRAHEPTENVEERFGGGYWSRRRQQQLNRSSSSTGSASQQGPVAVVDIDDDEPANKTSPTANGSDASTKSPDKPNVATENKTAATIGDLTKDLKCAICLGSIENITATVCGHIFCEGCILPAIEIQKKCPICRTHLTKKSIHPLFF
jgi:hypothetical protein